MGERVRTETGGRWADGMRPPTAPPLPLHVPSPAAAARWLVMLADLAGEPAPPMPQIPGRLHRALNDEPAAPLIADEMRAAAGWVRPGMRGPKA
jgi:hypothetical protein